jgi:hypothetical protein
MNKKDDICLPFISPNGTRIVVRGSEFICRAKSHSMAKRIADALNRMEK